MDFNGLTVSEGTVLENRYGARYRVEVVHGDGAEATIIHGGKTGGEGLHVWIDGRDIRESGFGLRPVVEVP